VRIDSNHTLNSLACSTSAVSQPGQTGSSESGFHAAQLSQLSDVLNSLAARATSILNRASTLTSLVQTGAYQVPSQTVANRIVSDTFGAG